MTYKRCSPRRSALITKYLLIVVVLLLMLGVMIGWYLNARLETMPSPAHQKTFVSPSQSTLYPGLQVTPSETNAALAYHPPDLSALQALALDLINQNRSAAELAPVVWDAAAARIAQAHAEDMLAGPYFSHWNRQGYGPEHRAALLAGFTDVVFENIHAYSYSYDDGRPAAILDWRQRVLDAQSGLMDSPGHRANILDPAHTHVGVGIAYRADIGEMRLVQLFLNRYVQLDALPAELPSDFTVRGQLLNNATDPLINLAYEPFPRPLSLEQLAQTSSYQSAVEFFSAPLSTVEGARFSARLLLDPKRAAGLYHIRVFVVTANGDTIPAAEAILTAP